MRWLRASHLVRVSASQAGVAPAGRHPSRMRSFNGGQHMTSRVGAVSEDFRKLALGYGLTTAEILYRMPDHPSILQSYLWQDYDLCANSPALTDLLSCWEEQLERPLFRGRGPHSRLTKPAELPPVDAVCWFD